LGAGNTVGITGTPNVNIASGTVGISGTPLVDINAGTVTAVTAITNNVTTVSPSLGSKTAAAASLNGTNTAALIGTAATIVGFTVVVFQNGAGATQIATLTLEDSTGSPVFWQMQVDTSAGGSVVIPSPSPLAFVSVSGFDIAITALGLGVTMSICAIFH
jgi:hypothetical protein